MKNKIIAAHREAFNLASIIAALDPLVGCFLYFLIQTRYSEALLEYMYRSRYQNQVYRSLYRNILNLVIKIFAL